MTAAGDELPPLEVRVRRADLVRYAGASLDFNPIHWNEKVAGQADLACSPWRSPAVSSPTG